MKAPPKVGCASPWGEVQNVTVLAPGIVSVSTAGHGGVWLSPERLAKLPAVVRQRRDYAPRHLGWFEEDCAACIPLLVFFDDVRDRFSDDVRESFHATVESVYPEDLAALVTAGLVPS